MMSLKAMALCFVVLGMVTAGAARAANPLVASTFQVSLRMICCGW